LRSPPHADLVFLSRDPREHHQIVLVSGRPPGLPNLIVNQISFRVDDLASLQRFYASLEGEDVSDLDPSNHGNAWSLYFRDPEGNRLEVFVDTDWYISQPFKIPLDLHRPEQEIREEPWHFAGPAPASATSSSGGLESQISCAARRTSARPEGTT
jgi:catechol-2,3-dioxygenase